MRYKICIFAFLVLAGILGSMLAERNILWDSDEREEEFHLEAGRGFELEGIILPSIPSLLKKCFSTPYLGCVRSFFFFKTELNFYRQSFFQSLSFETILAGILIHAP